MGRQQMGDMGVDEGRHGLPLRIGCWHLALSPANCPQASRLQWVACPHGLAPPPRTTKCPEHGLESPLEVLIRQCMTASTVCVSVSQTHDQGCPVSLLQAQQLLSGLVPFLLFSEEEQRAPRLQPLS